MWEGFCRYPKDREQGARWRGACLDFVFIFLFNSLVEGLLAS